MGEVQGAVGTWTRGSDSGWGGQGRLPGAVQSELDLRS